MPTFKLVYPIWVTQDEANPLRQTQKICRLEKRAQEALDARRGAGVAISEMRLPGA